MSHSNLIVNYGKIQVKQGNFIDVYRSIHKPSIQYSFIKNTYYCLLMVDMDSPNKTNPIYKYWLHWMIINIHCQKNLISNYNLITNYDLINEYIYGQTIMQYTEPTPEKDTGPHRFIFLLYKQPQKLNLNNNLPSRKKFNLKIFVNKYNLELLSVISFKSEYPKYEK